MVFCLRTGSLMAAAAAGLSLGSSALAQGSGTSQVPTPAAAKQEAVGKVVKPDGGAIIKPRVFFVAPKDGASVKSPFKVKFGIEGLSVAKAGPIVPGTGHHHVIVDGGPVAKGAIVPKDETHLHFGDAQTETELKLPKGKHALTLQFADGSHASYGEELAATITVNVR